jgi:hypothetical protein
MTDRHAYIEETEVKYMDEETKEIWNKVSDNGALNSSIFLDSADSAFTWRYGVVGIPPADAYSIARFHSTRDFANIYVIREKLKRQVWRMGFLISSDQGEIFNSGFFEFPSIEQSPNDNIADESCQYLVCGQCLGWVQPSISGKRKGRCQKCAFIPNEASNAALVREGPLLVNQWVVRFLFRGDCYLGLARSSCDSDVSECDSSHSIYSDCGRIEVMPIGTESLLEPDDCEGLEFLVLTK